MTEEVGRIEDQELGQQESPLIIKSIMEEVLVESAVVAPDPNLEVAAMEEDLPEICEVEEATESKFSETETQNVAGEVTETDDSLQINDEVGTTGEGTPTTPTKEEETEDPEPSEPVTLAEPDEDDDIICLNSDDDEGDAQSDVIVPKRRKTDECDSELDEGEVVSSVMERANIQTMSRRDLEDLVLRKIVDAVVSHTEVGQLRSRILELQMQKDRMASKLGVMMKQVVELAKAMSSVTTNEARDAKNRQNKPHVIRFNRSVGLQTSIEPSVRSAPPRIIRVPEATQNGVKQYGASTGKMPVYAGAANGNFSLPQSHGVKRVYQGNRAGDVKPTGSQNPSPQPSPRKVYSPATGPPRMLPIAPKPVTIVPTLPSSITVSTTQSGPGVVDLTDDDPPTGLQQNSAASVATPSGGQTTIINGVKYQVVSHPAAAQGVQLVSPSTAPATKFFVTGSGQSRPVLLQQLTVGSGPQAHLAGNQPIVIRGVTNPSPVTFYQRPAAPRQQSEVSANGTTTVSRVAATIPSRAGGTLLSATSNTQRRFVLPPFPLTPPSKAKGNEAYKPPPKPELTLNEQADGIVLSWNLPTIHNMAEVTTYQIFACQESLSSSSSRPTQWKRVGDVKALPLPMACTLSQFTDENRYYFIVRGIDVYGRVGAFCDAQNILLKKRNK